MRKTLQTILLILFILIPRGGYCRFRNLVSGKVTYTTSRSMYISLKQAAVVSQGDTVLAGTNQRELEPVMVKAVSRRTVVLERVPSLYDVVRGCIVYFHVFSAQTKTAAMYNEKNGRKEQDESKPYRHGIPITGRVSFQYYRYRGEDGKKEFDQPSLFLDTRYTGFSGLPLSMNLRFRTRLQRELMLPDGRETNNERTDRLYDLSFEYGNRGSSSYVGIGRIRKIRAGGMGGIDGIVFERSLRNNIKAGIFGGVAPELHNFIGDKKAVKRGGYISWTADSQSLNMEVVASYIAENNPGRYTRHLLYLEHSLYYGRKLSVNQEVVLNLKTTGEGRESENLQNIRSNIRYSPTNYLNLRGSYYGYLVQEYRDLYSVLDPVDDLRYSHNHSFLPVVELFLPYRFRISGETLIGRESQGGTGVLSYAVRSRATDLFNSGFDGAISRIETRQNNISGHHTQFSISRFVTLGLSMNMNLRIDQYRYANIKEYKNFHVRTGVFKNFGQSLYCSLNITRSWGKNINSNQFFIEWGKRFYSPRK